MTYAGLTPRKRSNRTRDNAVPFAAELRVCLSALVLLAAAGISASAAPLTVLTQNMDEGTDYSALLTAGSPLAFAAAVTQTYQEIEATQPAERAAALATEIAAQRPDLVTLQEASIVRTGSRSNPVATIVQSDLLQSLLTSLSGLGQHYAAAVIGTELDQEVPSTLGYDVRLTTQDVILARTDLPSAQFGVANPQARQFSPANQLVVPTAVGDIELPRGWASVDVTDDGSTFRLVTTHLDTGQLDPSIPVRQADELLQTAGNTPLPVLYAGDFNTVTDNPSAPAYAAYQALLNGGLTDSWPLLHPGDPGYTCCQAPDLLNPTPSLTERNDLILTHGAIGVEDIDRIGISQNDRTASGLWPSDHAGLVATVDVPEPSSFLLLGGSILGLELLLRRRAPKQRARPRDVGEGIAAG
jgi:endonuclease/exonuclease/phosphatase family metal-dependent hydrolase